MEPLEQRDPVFWGRIFRDPDVVPTLFGQAPESVIALLQNPSVMPLATEHGGFMFISRCGFGRVWELHTAYTREGWGREVHRAGKAALRRMFADGAQIIFTHEQIESWRTRPPKSFGFRPEGEPFAHEFGVFRLWLLTREAWEASPACARLTGMH